MSVDVRMRPLFLLAILALSLFSGAHCAHAEEEKKCPVLLASLNAFKFIDDKNFLPSPEAQAKKLENVLSLISGMQEGAGPALLALTEIDEAHLTALFQSEVIQSRGYQTHVVASTADDRGNNVGLLSRFPLLGEPISHTYWDPSDPIWKLAREGYRKKNDKGAMTRSILEVHLGLPNQEKLIVFVNHWPSKKLGDWAALQRQQAATYLKNLTNKILIEEPNANILILGDFNAEPSGPEMRAGLQLDPRGYGQLVNLENLAVDYRNERKEFTEKNKNASKKEINEHLQKIYDARGTHYFFGGAEWMIFDQMIISSHLLNFFVSGSFHPLKESRFLDTDGRPLAFDPKTGLGVSDHFPVGGLFLF